MLKNLITSKVVLFGAGNNSFRVLQYLFVECVSPAYFVDNNHRIKEKYGYTVHSPHKLLEENKQNLWIVITTDLDCYNEIKAQLFKMGLGECIWDYKSNHEMSYRIKYYLNAAKSLNLENPITFDEKIFWLQLYDQRPLYRTLTDKISVKEYVAQKIGQSYVTPIIEIWEDPEDIPFESLPDEYVLKCNHDSGWVLIKRKSDILTPIDIEEIKKQLYKNLNVDYFQVTGTYGYKDIVPRVFAEKMIFTRNNERLIDYKFFCFNGEPKFLYTARNREGTSGVAFYDHGFNPLPVCCRRYPVCAVSPKPESFNKMLDICKKLSAGIPFVRIDLYQDGNDEVVFSEFTFAPSGGVLDIYPDEWHTKFGNYLELTDISQFVEEV